MLWLMVWACMAILFFSSPFFTACLCSLVLILHLTHMDQYIPYHYHHHSRMLTGVIRGMCDRALRICEYTSRQPEMEHLARVFEANGFPDKLVRKTQIKPQRQQTCEPEEEEPLKTLRLPYVRGLSEKIEKTCGPLWT